MTHKQNFKIYIIIIIKKNTKQSRDIHTWNSLDCRFDKEFYYGFQKHQIA